MAEVQSVAHRKADLVKKMTDLDEFFLEYRGEGQNILVQGTQNPGKKDPHVKGRKPREEKHTVVVWDRMSLSWVSVPVTRVKSIRALQTVMTNTFRSI